MPTKYLTTVVKLDAASAAPGTAIVPRGTAWRSFMLIALSGATDFNLAIGSDQLPIPVLVPGFSFLNSDPCDIENQGLFASWIAQPAATVTLLIEYGEPGTRGGSFNAPR